MNALENLALNLRLIPRTYQDVRNPGALLKDYLGLVENDYQVELRDGTLLNVRHGTAYPAVLFTVFEGDTRVDPMHARKMCALLQEATAGPGPILLRREVGVGHSTRSVSRDVALAADQLSFLASCLW